MRTNIVHPGADELTYEIREIVEFGKKLENLGINMIWENIGDPVAKGEKVPEWIREIIIKTVTEDNSSFGYSPTKGLLDTRKFIAENRSGNGGVNITEDDILFFNGLGDAISKVYSLLNKNARVIGPNPAYPTHSSAEGAHAGSHHITYNLNPQRNWLPDIEDLRNKVKYNPAIAGILIINPDNPTGMVYPRKILKEIINIAEEFDLFIVADEIYENLVYEPEEMVSLEKIIGDVPAIAMKGLSKEIPWPGARCGWIEFYNKDKDKVFSKYAHSLVNAKMLEVCSTTLPQRVIPQILGDSRYKKYLTERSKAYEKKAEKAYKVFSKTPGVVAPRPAGAFYMTVVFRDGVLNNKQKLQIENNDVRALIESSLENISFDKRFSYFLMANAGICVVPLSGFNSELQGFRLTLLEKNEEIFDTTLSLISTKIKEYLSS